MITLETLLEEIKQLDTEMTALSERKQKLMSSVRELTYQEHVNRFNVTWNVAVGDCLALFTKDQNNTFFDVKTMEVTEVDREAHVLYGVIGFYTIQFEDEPEFKCSAEAMSVASMKEHEDRYNIYVIDPVQHALLLQSLCSLKVSSANIEEYHSAIKEVADRQIS